jgi:GNAT superfamily N-acetyltransferase
VPETTEAVHRNAGVTVRRADSWRDRRCFVGFPYDLYEGHRYWVPPLRRDQKHTLNPKKNAFFEHGDMQLFLAEDEAGETVGRIAAIVNGQHLKKYDDGAGFFGFFECSGGEATAETLFEAAAAWLRRQGLKKMRGPANPSLNDTAGLLVDGFNRPPALLMPYNPPRYEDFLLESGFERVMTMWAYYAHYKYADATKLRRGTELVYRRHPGLELRTMDTSRFDEEARTIRRIYNEAWKDNWGHVPMTEAEFEQLAEELKQIVDPNVVFLLEDEGEPVAFSIALPDLNQALQHVKGGRLFPLGLPKLLAYTNFGGVHELRMPLMGVLPKYRGQGLYAPLVLATVEEAPRNGYPACEMSWVLDTNEVLKNALEEMGGVKDKEYAMFEKTIS